MIFVIPFIYTTLLAGLAAATPTILPPDSAVGNEVPVSAPYGILMSDSVMPTATPARGMMDSSSTMMEPSTMASSTMKEVSTMKEASPMKEASAMKATSTAVHTKAYSWPSYGSGSTKWGESGYNNCVQQCVASFGSMGTGSYMPTATHSMGSTGGSVTHTVIVAPTQGVLRYVPFAINASVGDTVMFMWGANNHTVTKSSQLAICNKTSDAPFASGEHNKSFVFTQIVNNTNTTFFYCGTPGHCEKGMFGIINPPQAGQPSNSVASMLPGMIQNSSSMAAMAAYTDTQTMNNSMAANWGGNMDMSQMPTWAYPYMAHNIMYMRNFLASNPDVMAADGSVNFGNAGSNPLMIPMDITQVALSASSSSTLVATSTSTSSSSSPSSSASPAAAVKSNSAQLLRSSGALVAVVTVLVALIII